MLWALRLWAEGSVNEWASVPAVPWLAGGVKTCDRLACVPIAWCESDASEWSPWVSVTAAALPVADGCDPSDEPTARLGIDTSAPEASAPVSDGIDTSAPEATDPDGADAFASDATGSDGRDPVAAATEPEGAEAFASEAPASDGREAPAVDATEPDGAEAFAALATAPEGTDTPAVEAIEPEGTETPAVDAMEPEGRDPVAAAWECDGTETAATDWTDGTLTPSVELSRVRTRPPVVMTDRVTVPVGVPPLTDW